VRVRVREACIWKGGGGEDLLAASVGAGHFGQSWGNWRGRKWARPVSISELHGERSRVFHAAQLAGLRSPQGVVIFCLQRRSGVGLQTVKTPQWF
jgi:hypothetical protein